MKSFPLTANGKLDRNSLISTALDSVVVDFGTELVEKSGLPTQSSSCSQSMVQHVSSVIHSVNGRWPRPDSFFTSVGVDSLGAIIFVRNLSDSLGGARISPADVFDAQLTISAFSKKIFEEMQMNHPSTLADLGIDRAVDSDGSVEEVERDLQDDVEADAELGFLSNWRLYEGIRGVFTFLVLWDHYVPPNGSRDDFIFITEICSIPC